MLTFQMKIAHFCDRDREKAEYEDSLTAESQLDPSVGACWKPDRAPALRRKMG